MENLSNIFRGISLMTSFSKFTDLEKLSLNEKVDLFYNSVQTSSHFPKIERVRTKSREKALEYKKSGIDFFCRDDLIEALKCFTKSAAVAPPDSPELAIAYANRSAALYRLERFEACLVDINRALKENYPETSKPKLRDRKKSCLSKLQKLNASIMVHLKLCESSIVDDDTLLSNLQFQLRQCQINSNSTDMSYDEKFYLPRVNFRNKTLSNVTEKVGIKFCSKFGRHIVALKDIEPGEIIAIEKPYASVLSWEKRYSHCANCFVKCESLIPCPNCSSVLFCSKRCLEDAFNRFHQMECQVLLRFGYPITTNLNWSVLRLLMMATKQGKELQTLMSHPVYKNPLKKVSCEVPDRLDPRDYNNIHNLEDHLDKRNDFILFFTVDNLATYIHILKNTTFFDSQCDNTFSTKEKERYLSHLLLKFIFLRFNSYEIGESYESPGHLPAANVNRAPRIGSGLYSFHSLFNHACNGNVVGTFHKDTMVTRAIDPIRASEQLFVNYGISYEIEARDKRQKKILEKYFFKCLCTACEKNWPLAVNLVSVKSEILSVKELHRCWKALEERFAPGVPKHQHSAKLFNLLCEYLKLLRENFEMPNQEYHECQRRLMSMLTARGNYYEFVREGVLYSL